MSLSERNQVMSMIGGYRLSQAISAAARMGIFDALREGPSSAAALAARSQTQATYLPRLLHALAQAGLLSVAGTPPIFSLAAAGEYLAADHPLTLKHFAAMAGSRWYWEPWCELKDQLRSGTSAFAKVHGRDFFDYLDASPEAAHAFGLAMTGSGTAAADAIAEGFDFTAVGSLVDVGGGLGKVLARLLERYGKLRGVLFDTPTTITEAARSRDEIFGASVNRERLQLVAGSFFHSVPKDADVYLLRHIVHDWGDAEAQAILETCHAAMRPTARLLLVERLITQATPDLASALTDLEMMVMMRGGRERTEAEMRTLLEASGYEVLGVRLTSADRYVLEAGRRG